MANPLPPGVHSNLESNFPYAAVASQTLRRQQIAPIIASMVDTQRNSVLLDSPNILLQAVIVPGENTSEGRLVESVATAWFEIVERIARDPQSIYAIHWRKWEEIIAGAYAQEGYEVVLTPRSNDKGRDVIATKHGIGSVCFYDQVKAYHPGNLVTFEEVSAMVGVLSVRPNVSKGLITTTSSFAPGVLTDPALAHFMPHRLELKDRDVLLPWLQSLAAK